MLREYISHLFVKWKSQKENQKIIRWLTDYIRHNWKEPDSRAFSCEVRNWTLNFRGEPAAKLRHSRLIPGDLIELRSSEDILILWFVDQSYQYRGLLGINDFYLVSAYRENVLAMLGDHRGL